MKLLSLHSFKTSVSKVLGKIIVDLFLLELTPLLTFFLKQILIKYAQTNQHLLCFCVILFQLK